MAHARTIGIWISGLIAGACLGALVGYGLMGRDGDAPGILAGLMAFTCLRLWKAPRP